VKVYLVEASSKHNKYTYRTLHHLMLAFGVQEVEQDQADLILVSIDDPDDLPLVRRARRIAGERPVIAGGFECFCGEYLLSYVDACNVGEGFEFFEALGSGASLDELYSLPFVLTRDKKVVRPSTRIDKGNLPLVKLGKTLWYYLAGRGCNGKCAFCLTSFAYPNWSNERILIQRADRHARTNGGRLTLITNDSSEIDFVSRARCVQSVRVADYLKSHRRFQSASYLHFGIEGFSEEHRRYFGKPIKDVAIFELIERLQSATKPEAEFFFIPGLPGTFDAMMEFAEMVPVCAKVYPRIHIKMTTLEPSPHTPLWTMNLADLELLTAQQIQEFRSVLKSRNVGFRLFQVRSRARGLWRAAISNCAPDETKKLGRQPKPKMITDDFLQHLQDNDLMHLVEYDGRPMPNSQIVTPWRELRDKMAAKKGLPPVNYKFKKGKSAAC